MDQEILVSGNELSSVDRPTPRLNNTLSVHIHVTLLLTESVLFSLPYNKITKKKLPVNERNINFNIYTLYMYSSRT